MTAALSLTPLGGDRPLDRRIAAAQQAAHAEPHNLGRWLELVLLFDEKIGGGDSAVLAQARDALEHARRLSPGDREVRELEAHLLLADHKFAEAEAAAQRLTERAPDSVRGLATLGDAQLEQGKYAEALATYQRMLDHSVDERTLVRAAWLRWLTGDVDGAIELDRQAVTIGSTGRAEPQAVAAAMEELGRMYFMKGDLTQARAQYDAALLRVPGFAAALYGRGVVSAVEGKHEAAIADLKAAVSSGQLLGAQWELARVLERVGRSDEARQHHAAIERSGERLDRRTFALYLATQGRDLDRALALIRHEQKIRGEDVYSEDVAAWVLFRKGQLAAADAESENALRLGTKDARFLYHRGAILRALGRVQESRAVLTAALAANPHFDVEEAALVRTWLAEPRR